MAVIIFDMPFSLDRQLYGRRLAAAIAADR
jgi:hypothetical protein